VLGQERRVHGADAHLSERSAGGSNAFPIIILAMAPCSAHAGHCRGDRVQVFVSDGQMIGIFGEPGSGDGQFSQPTCLAFLPDGRLLVSDETTNRIMILSTPLAPPGASPVSSPPA
jgi:hypothetical protein